MGSCPLSDILLYDSICSFPQATGHHTLSPSTLAVLPQEQQLEPKKPFQERREREETFAIRSPILNNTLLMVLVLGPSPPFFRLPLRQLSPHVMLSSTCVTSRTLNPLPVATLRAVRTQGIGAGAADDAAVLRRPVVSPVVADEDTGEESLVRKGEVGEKTEEAEWVDWEDQILQETVPLVGFVRMILHSGKYEIDDRLSSDHEKTIVEKLLLYHPESEKKIGCGVEYIKDYIRSSRSHVASSL
ncbi:protein DCL, chloroplastic isoform X3 [Dendrobium catenatum]|uniref:protein DCL, chloroplastic isoform X3 n=1 Tax=Dendrobium catenatum TaxID=906689 RepID=UPI00109F3A37|nr:protein DCL, chloroplastic isoform X3 [Dendrobium catenatum]